VEHQGEVWVFTGDYKLQHDGVSEPFELIRCHTFITESTFGLPVYNWQPQQQVINQINEWWKYNAAHGRASVLSAYALGKAQRILRNIDSGIGKIFVHGAIESTNQVLRQQGIALPATHLITSEVKKEEFSKALIVCPPSAIGSPWIKRFGNYSLGIASGWMTLRGAKRRRGADRGFVLSDHVDWNELNTAVHETGAEKIFVTHGYSETYAKFLRERGMDAQAVRTEYDGELVDAEPVEL
jgi:putative mRNA 3-end processing factor